MTRGFPDFRSQITSFWLLLGIDELPVFAPLIAGLTAYLYVIARYAFWNEYIEHNNTNKIHTQNRLPSVLWNKTGW